MNSLTRAYVVVLACSLGGAAAFGRPSSSEATGLDLARSLMFGLKADGKSADGCEDTSSLDRCRSWFGAT